MSNTDKESIMAISRYLVSAFEHRKDLLQLYIYIYIYIYIYMCVCVCVYFLHKIFSTRTVEYFSRISIYFLI